MPAARSAAIRSPVQAAFSTPKVIATGPGGGPQAHSNAATDDAVARASVASRGVMSSPR